MHSEMSFQMKTLLDQHCCNGPRKNKRLTSKWLARKYLNRFKITPNWRLLDFRDTIMHKHNYEISLFKCTKARKMALKMTYRTYKDQFLKLKDHAVEVIKPNAGSTIRFKLNGGVFQREYVYFDALKKKGWKVGVDP